MVFVPPVRFVPVDDGRSNHTGFEYWIDFVNKAKKWSQRELGLDILLPALDYLLSTQHLHYGYFSDDLEPTYLNLREAQDAHSELILSQIPEGAKRVLDVGCGAGSLADKLIKAGYEVDCVCPSDVLIRRAKELLKDRVTTHKCYYEDFASDKKFDLILFSESFQYIDIDKSLDQSLGLVKENGHILICDIFKINATGKSPFSGGHKFTKFQEKVATRPLTLLNDIDISLETGRTMDVFNDFLVRVAAPAKESLFNFAQTWHPWLFKLITWRFKKKLAKIDRKYLSGAKTSENFVKHKSYRLLLYQETGAGKQAEKMAEEKVVAT